MSSADKQHAYVPPVVDEWGIYDPDQAGVAALLARLDARRAMPPSRQEARNMVASMREVKKLADER